VQQVAEAGGAAAVAGEDAGAAMKAERDRVQLDIPDDVLERMAKAISDQNIAALEQRGAFDTPPEPVRAPDEPAQAPAGADQTQADQPPEQTQEPAPAPQRRTWAHRFLGVDQ
jgi:hypothetical protein